MSRSRPALQVAAGAVLISLSPVFVALAHTGPNATALYRLLVGSLVLAPVFALDRRAVPSPWVAWLGALCGLLLAADLVTWHHSIRAIGPGMATMLSNFQVLFVAAYGVLVLRERPSWRFAAGVVMAAGALVLVFGEYWPTVGAAYRWGVAWGLLTAVLYAAFVLTLRAVRLRPEAPSAVGTLALLSLAGAAVLAVVVPLSGESFAIPDLTTFTELVLYGLNSQVLGWMLIARGLPGVPASQAGLLLLLQPFLAVVWDMTFFARARTAREIAGVAVALVAIYLGSVSRPERVTSSS